MVQDGARRPTVRCQLMQAIDSETAGVIGERLADACPHRLELNPKVSRNVVRKRELARVHNNFFLLPFFPSLFCVLRLSCARLTARLARCLALLAARLIFVVIADGYHQHACLGACLNHGLVFEALQKPLNPAFVAIHCIREVANGHRQLAAFEAQSFTLVPNPDRLPRCAQHQIGERHRLRVVAECRVPDQAAVDLGVAAHARASANRRLRRLDRSAVVLTLWQSVHSSHRLGGSLSPPSLSGTRWSTSRFETR